MHTTVHKGPTNLVGPCRIRSPGNLLGSVLVTGGSMDCKQMSQPIGRAVSLARGHVAILLLVAAELFDDPCCRYDARIVT